MNNLDAICERLVAKGLMEWNEDHTAIRLTTSGHEIVEIDKYGELMDTTIEENIVV